MALNRDSASPVPMQRPTPGSISLERVTPTYIYNISMMWMQSQLLALNAPISGFLSTTLSVSVLA